MVSHITHRGYGIEYFAGVTKVHRFGFTKQVWKGIPEMEGRKLAKKYIDKILDEISFGG
jgi:hypothetical protein